MLQGSQVEDDVDALGGAQQPVAIPDVADEEAQVRPLAEEAALVELLRLVAPEDPNDRDIGLEEAPDEVGADRPGTAGDEDLAPTKRLERLNA